MNQKGFDFGNNTNNNIIDLWVKEPGHEIGGVPPHCSHGPSFLKIFETDIFGGFLSHFRGLTMIVPEANLGGGGGGG